MIRRTAAALLLAVAACGDPAGPALPHGGTPPAALDVSWSGYGGGSTRIQLVGNELHYIYVPPFYRPGMPIDTLRVAATAERWATFWATAESIGLRTWPTECSDPSIMDGGGMSLEIEHDGRRLAISTMNASPGPNRRCDRGTTTVEEVAFRDAVSALVGSPFPGRWRHASALPSEGTPYLMYLSVSRQPARRDVVGLIGDTVMLARLTATGSGVRGDTVRVVPSASAWRGFWSALTVAGVVGWPQECADTRVADGAAYQFGIEARGGGVRAFVLNAYPQPDGRCLHFDDPTPSAPASLDMLLAAVSALVGQPFP